MSTLEVPVVRPAVVPVDTFPHVFLATNHDRDEVRIAQEVTHALISTTDSHIARLTLDEVASHEFPTASLLVVIELELHDLARTRWDVSRPCITPDCDERAFSNVEVRAMRGVGRLAVYQGPSRELVQRAHVQDYEEGRDPESMRLRVVERVAERIVDLFVARNEMRDVRVYRVRTMPEVSAALELARAGDWLGARRRLESLRDSARSLDVEDRARFFYNLGIARRYAVREGEAIEARLNAAEAALTRAVRLVPSTQFARALDELLEHREHVRNAAEHERVREHNFALDAREREPAPVMPVPDAYSD